MNRKLLPILALAALVLSACGVSEADIQLTVLAAETNAVGTVYAQLTQIALLTPSATFTLAATNTPAITNTPFATATTGLAAAPTGGCDVMTFVSDVTVPDGEEMSPNENFTKTWELKNDGTCEWTTAYTVAFDSGDQMGGPSSQPLTAAVAPGATGQISVELVAPATPGTYSSYWVIRNNAGQIFGSFFVQIKVV